MVDSVLYEVKDLDTGIVEKLKAPVNLKEERIYGMSSGPYGTYEKYIKITSIDGHMIYGVLPFLRRPSKGYRIKRL